jgi:hypothetical protein
MKMPEYSNIQASFVCDRKQKIAKFDPETGNTIIYLSFCNP